MYRLEYTTAPNENNIITQVFIRFENIERLMYYLQTLECVSYNIVPENLE